MKQAKPQIDKAMIRQDRSLLLGALVEAGADVSNPAHFCCPFHGENRPSAGTHEDGSVWRYKCFACGVSGDVFDIVSRVRNISIAEAMKVVSGQASTTTPATARRPQAALQPARKQLIDWQPIYDQARAELDPGEIHDAADAIGLSGEGYDALGVCIINDCYSFPERDAEGRIIGIVKRTTDGAKIACKGSKRGLTMPWPLPDVDPVLVVEGASDTAAAIEAGFNAVGRPSATGGGAYLAELLRGRAVVIVGENDQKADGSWPGRDGAERIASKLRPGCKSIKIVYPPPGTKDLRRWFSAGGAS